MRDFFYLFQRGWCSGCKRSFSTVCTKIGLNFCYVKYSILQALLLNKETNKQEQNMNSICCYSKNLRRLFKTNWRAGCRTALCRMLGCFFVLFFCFFGFVSICINISSCFKGTSLVLVVKLCSVKFTGWEVFPPTQPEVLAKDEVIQQSKYCQTLFIDLFLELF